NNVIREVDHVTGIITTVAGNSTAGYSGDGGSATSARLDSPHGIAVDAQGNLFIADTYNGRIREVNHATGVIYTVAGTVTFGYRGDGGPAIDAELDTPWGIAVSSSDKLFIADSGNSVIRTVDISTGIIATVAGVGSRLGYSG